ncbi:AIG2 family [Pyrenophora seminiperda CCB06]|uniref:gamma-glutamylcyclotransferase n=1 Tax=Pyrenophora seminiperda CCB06 TaxID=1302712 RepID=A0A3M7MG44_9PLEO|nr:AIG2 family [Pyrenophora seminiperda CCB06]
MPDTTPPPPTPTNPTLYFGYGSNLWHHQMLTRCPTSTYIGIARLRPYTWLINTRGYANVVSAPTPTSSTSTTTTTTTTTPPPTYSTTVYGLVYTLHPTDEAQLDINEGVPTAYTKELLPCSFWALDPSNPFNPSPDSQGNVIDTSTPPTINKCTMLVYIDRKRTEASVPRKEYVYRMNRGIEDAVKCGVPGGYVEEVMRRYVPADDGEDDDDDHDKGGKKKKEGKTKKEERKKIAQFARGQAKRFKDESGVIK